MREPKLALKVIEKGTHNMTWDEANNDTPSPCECVAESLADLEYRIAELVKVGGYASKKHGPMSVNAHALECVLMSAKCLARTLSQANDQNWKLELERNPFIMTHYPMDSRKPPVEGCECEICVGQAVKA